MKHVGRGIVLKHLEALLSGIDAFLESSSASTREAATECLESVQDICGVQSVVNKMKGLNCFDK